MSERPDQLIHPPALRPGDGVHVVSPSGPVTPEILAEGLDLLRTWELDVHIDDDAYHRRPPFDYLAGPDEIRLEAFLRAWSDPDCRAIICSRGGYGAMRLLPHLHHTRIRSAPPLLVGFSDITALHLYVAGVCNVATLHGPVVKSLRLHSDSDFDSLERLHDALFATNPAPQPWTGLRTLRAGRASGPVYGGNLSLLIPLLSSPYCPPLNGAIIIVEEVGEQDYRLDRLLTALRLASNADIAGLVLGDFSDCSGVYVEDGEFSRFLDDLGRQFDCPVVADAPVGHQHRNASFPVGVQAELDADAGTLTFARHAVEPR